MSMLVETIQSCASTILVFCPESHTQVVSVTPDMSAIEAMGLMNEKQISAVAVVDGAGKIIGNFSISEMR